MARAKLERSFRTGKCDSVTFRDIIATFRDSRLPVACAHGAGLGAGRTARVSAQISAQVARRKSWRKSWRRSHGVGLGACRTAQASAEAAQRRSRRRPHGTGLGAGRTTQVSAQGRQLKGAPWLGGLTVAARAPGLWRMKLLGDAVLPVYGWLFAASSPLRWHTLGQ